MPSFVSTRNSTAWPPFSERMREACCAITFWKLSNLTAPSPDWARACWYWSNRARTTSDSLSGWRTRYSAGGLAAAGDRGGGGGGGGTREPCSPMGRPSSIARSRFIHSSFSVL